MKRALIRFLVFGCLGTTSEIWFTAIMDNIAALQNGAAINWSLTGKSYIWMFFIYGLAGPLFAFFFQWIGQLPQLARLIVYMLGIFIIEFITGGILDLITGSCPWEYTSKWNVCGYIRLDYAPVWFFFGWVLEKVHIFLNHQLIVK